MQGAPLLPTFPTLSNFFVCQSINISKVTIALVLLGLAAAALLARAITAVFGLDKQRKHLHQKHRYSPGQSHTRIRTAQPKEDGEHLEYTNH